MRGVCLQSDEFFVVCEGEIEVSTVDAQGEEFVLCNKRNGTFFNHQALFEVGSLFGAAGELRRRHIGPSRVSRMSTGQPQGHRHLRSRCTHQVLGPDTRKLRKVRTAEP